MQYSVHSLLLGVLQVFSSPAWVLASNLHKNCQLQCAQEVLEDKVGSYIVCMRSCFTKGGDVWMFQNETEVCEFLEHDFNAMPTCPAGSANILSYNISSVRGGFNVTHEYIIVEWTPCPFGLDDVKGYEVRLREVNLHQYDFCKQVYLKEKLNLHALNASFSVLFENQELRYGREYSITIEGLPMTSHRSYYPIQYVAQACESLNKPGSCECGLESIDRAPQPNATIQGYMVNVTVPKLKSCFDVYMYKLVIVSASREGVVETAIQEETIVFGDQPSSDVSYTFFPVYPTGYSSNTSLYIQYQARAYGGKSLSSYSLLLNVSNWKPNVPISFGGSGHIVLSWDCAPSYFNIKEYELQLNWYGLHGAESIRHQSSHSFHSNCSSNGRMTVTLRARSGIYDARLRELRHSGFDSTPWSLLSDRAEVVADGTVTFVNAKEVVVAISVVFPSTVVIISILVTCYCMKKGRCKKIHHRVPSRFPYLTDYHTGFEHHCYTVWIVWQADGRSSTHNELHAANIRHLAAFLTNCCGLSVILDQYEVPSVASFTSWLQEKQKEAKFVLFICPHTAPPHHAEVVSGVVGNFLAVFRLFQNALLNEDAPVEIATILLPYSDPDCSSAAQLLLSTTPTFKLMNDIESFYFFIQGLPKAGPFGRHVVKFVNKREYTETSEGLMLKNGMEEMVRIAQTNALDNFVDGQSNLSDAMSNTPELILDHQSDKSTSFIPHRRDIGKNCLKPVLQPPALKDEMLKSKPSECSPIPPPPVVPEEDPEQSLFMINSGSELLSLQPIESEPVDPVIADSWIPLLLPDVERSMQIRHPNSFSSLSQSVSLGTCSTGLSNQ